jgi:hygromycin-B 7''-O-kinase
MQKPRYHSKREYSQLFTDGAFWQPYVERVCTGHGFSCNGLRAGLAGTNPVFIVDDGGPGFVVKFFETQLFGTRENFAVECEIYALLANSPVIPAPALLADGQLFPDGDWPYIIISLIPGLSLGEVVAQVSAEDKRSLAIWLGQRLRRLHQLPIASPALQRSQTRFAQWLVAQHAACVTRQQQLGHLPNRLLSELDDYLLPVAHLFDTVEGPCLIHCDLNHDHLLGEFVAGHWRPTGIIDFGDARVGDRLYELVALHLGLFRTDKALLRLFLDSYGLDAGLQRQFVERAMAYTLLHEFDVLAEVADLDVCQVDHIATLAKQLWEV